MALALTMLVASCQSAATPASPVASVDSPDGPVPSGAIVVDASLLDILPETVDGIAVLPAVDTAASLLDDPELGRSAAAVAVGLAIDVGDPTGEFAVATVVRLRPGVMSDRYDEEWQADYETAACEPAGGVDTHDTLTLGGRAVETTACVEGARTYHARLGADVLVSITEVGQRRLGERMMAGLRG